MDLAYREPGRRCPSRLCTDEDELSPKFDPNIVREHRVDSIPFRQHVVESLNPRDLLVVEFADDESFRAAGVLDDIRFPNCREDIGDAADRGRYHADESVMLSPAKA